MLAYVSVVTPPPFVVSMNSLLRVGAEDALKHIEICLTKKWKHYYLETCGYVKSRVETTLVRATHCCIQDSHMLACKISVHQLQWEDGVGIHIFHQVRQ